MPLTSPTAPTQTTTLPPWGACIVVPAFLAVVVGLATLWLSPPLVDRASLAWLFAASAALGGSGLFAAYLARGEIRRLERELRREKAAAAWRNDAAQDDLLDDDGDAPLDVEAALSINHLRAAFDAADEAMVILDADLWVIASNPAATSLLGVAAALDIRWDQNIVWPTPITPVRVPLPEGGLLVVGRDSAQERLRAAQLDHMDGVADVAGMIVHDVNNALGAVAGYADFLVADLPAEFVAGRFRHAHSQRDRPQQDGVAPNFVGCPQSCGGHPSGSVRRRSEGNRPSFAGCRAFQPVDAERGGACGVPGQWRVARPDLGRAGPGLRRRSGRRRRAGRWE